MEQTLDENMILNKVTETDTDTEILKTNPNINADKLVKIRDTIESFDKEQQIQILKILKGKKINFNENKNGVFINLTNLSENTLTELESFIKHVETQESYLKQNEDTKNIYKENYFKDNCDININNDSGEI